MSRSISRTLTRQVPALLTLAIKSWVEWQHERELKAAADAPPERPITPQATAA